ncbi:MAG: hypothetical protein KC431_03845 [Myxococcales bacterium]|nr:hypothetical protein [Myxococcales bacterium]
MTAAPHDRLHALLGRFGPSLDGRERPELESSPQSLALIARGGPADQLVHALYSYWIDYDNGYLEDPGLLARALLDTVVVLAAHGRDRAGSWSVDEEQALGHAFRALHRRRDAIEAALGKKAVAALGEVVFAEVARLREAVLVLAPPADDWLELLNTAVVLWPEHGAAAFASLGEPGPEDWRSTMQLVSVLAYPTAQHPLWSRALLPWRRLGQEFGLHWSESSVAALALALADEPLRRGLEALRRWAEPGERAEVEAMTGDILEFLLESDLRRRRAILLAQLRAEKPANHWPDEYGQ